MWHTKRLFPGTKVGFACTSCSVTERDLETRSHQSNLAERDRSHSTAGFIDRRPDQDSPDGELDARVLAPLFWSADRRFRKWEDVVMDPFACNHEDPPDASDVTAAELAALHQELTVDPLRWFFDFAGDKALAFLRHCDASR